MMLRKLQRSLANMNFINSLGYSSECPFILIREDFDGRWRNKIEKWTIYIDDGLSDIEVEDIVSETTRLPKEVIVHLTDIRSMKDYTFGHSANVCILSLLTGLSLGYDQLKLRDLGTGALLHWESGRSWRNSEQQKDLFCWWIWVGRKSCWLWLWHS